MRHRAADVNLLAMNRPTAGRTEEHPNDHPEPPRAPPSSPVRPPASAPSMPTGWRAAATTSSSSRAIASGSTRWRGGSPTRPAARSRPSAPTSSEAADLARVETTLRTDASITVLVNNAGFGATAPLLGSDIARMDNMIALNVGALTRLTYAAVPGFVARGGGTVINISSIAAITPELLNGVYGGSKAYVLAFSQSLQHELADKGVRVQAVLPGATATEFWSLAGVPVAASAEPDRDERGGHGRCGAGRARCRRGGDHPVLARHHRVGRVRGSATGSRRRSFPSPRPPRATASRRAPAPGRSRR